MKMPETITNRSFLLIRLKQSFIEWINRCDPDSPLPKKFIKKSTVYLIEDIEYPEPDKINKIIKKHYKEIFIDQLNGWYTDKKLWPALSYDIFQEWLDVEHVEEGIDLIKGVIKKEKF